MNDKFTEKVKSRGYWRINFQPLVDLEKIKSLGDCRNIIEKNNVELRGWNYPHFPRRTGEDVGLTSGNNYYEGWIDWNNHKEFWRMYQSGQYIHYLALREDWAELSGWGITPNQEIKSGERIGIIGTTYQLTEVFEFLSRLVRAGIYDEGVSVSISLHNTKNRTLYVDSNNRWPFSSEYKTSIPEINFLKKYTKEELLTKSTDMAFDAVLYFFDRFNWHNPSAEIIKKDQDNLLNRRF